MAMQDVRWIIFVGSISLPLVVASSACGDEHSPVASGATREARAGMPAVQDSEIDTLQGTVASVERAGHYTYLELDADGQRRWIVVMGTTDAEVGDELEFTIFGTAHDFASRRLGRTFEELFFGRIASST